MDFNVKNSTADRPFRVFVSYSRLNLELKEQFDMNLGVMENQGLINVWSDNRLTGGEFFDPVIENNIRNSDIILFMVSNEFLRSKFIRENEMPLALQQVKEGHAVIVPIILKKCGWEEENWAKVQALPQKTKPVTDPEWHNIEAAFTSVEEGLRAVVKRLQSELRKDKSHIKTVETVVTVDPEIPKFIVLKLIVAVSMAILLTSTAVVCVNIFKSKETEQTPDLGNYDIKLLDKVGRTITDHTVIDVVADDSDLTTPFRFYLDLQIRNEGPELKNPFVGELFFPEEFAVNAYWAEKTSLQLLDYKFVTKLSTYLPWQTGGYNPTDLPHNFFGKWTPGVFLDYRAANKLNPVGEKDKIHKILLTIKSATDQNVYYLKKLLNVRVKVKEPIVPKPAPITLKLLHKSIQGYGQVKAIAFEKISDGVFSQSKKISVIFAPIKVTNIGSVDIDGRKLHIEFFLGPALTEINTNLYSGKKLEGDWGDYFKSRTIAYGDLTSQKIRKYSANEIQSGIVLSTAFKIDSLMLRDLMKEDVNKFVVGIKLFQKENDSDSGTLLYCDTVCLNIKWVDSFPEFDIDTLISELSSSTP